MCIFNQSQQLPMKNLAIKISLFLNYFVFAILLNSVGAVILQVQGNFGISESGASILEAFKDLPIAICSFLVASFLPRLGIKKGMLMGLGLVALICLTIPLFADSFWYFKLLFAVIGISFAIIKISVFATIGLITDGTKEHSSFMSWIEGFFMVGVLFGNLFFSWFVDDNNLQSTEWYQVYWFLSAMSIGAMVLLFFSTLDESQAQLEGSNPTKDFAEMLKLVIKPLVLVFVISAFLFVLIEQSFQTWTPTFYKDILKVPSSMSIQAGAILAGAFALGRILAGFILQRVHWLKFTVTCIIVLALCVIINLPLTKTTIIDPLSISWTSAPLIVYIFPLMGLFLAPIYPTINSVILSSLPKHRHSAMSGLIVVFSALGGTTGSVVTGNLFEHFDGVTAFYMSLIPMGLLLVSLVFLNKYQKANQTV